MKPFLSVGFFIALFLVERVFPFRSSDGFISQRKINNLILPVVTFLFMTFFNLMPSVFKLPTLQWNMFGKSVLSFLVLDILIYFWHRASHEVPFLWRFHKVHHSDTRLDVSTALRFHFLEVFLSVIVRWNIAKVLGIENTVLVFHELMIVLNAEFHHSNIKLPKVLEEKLSTFIVTPRYHTMHHSVEKKEADSNYSSVLSLWDRVFGSFTSLQRADEIQIGLSLKSEDLKERSLGKLLVLPLESDEGIS